MKNAVFTSLALVSASLVATATPTISNIAVSQDAEKNVTVTYDLSEDAIVTVAFTVGGEAVPVPMTVAGDANRRVAAGTGRKVVWNPNIDWPLQSGADVSATVSAWTNGVSPDYMAVRLRDDGTDLKIRYFATSNDVPGGVTSRLYKSDWLLMRRIPARGIKSRLGNDSTRKIYGRNYQTHLVSFTNDFYMAVYETTEAQYAHIANGANLRKSDDWSASFASAAYADEHPYIPVTDVFYRNHIRGDVQPDAAPASGKLIGKLRTLSGIATFDIPTEAQWEFACRAGTATTLNDGTDSADSDAGLENLKRVAWCSYNSDSRPHEVGLKKPNAWGLYDMLGNADEVPRDYYKTYTDADDDIDPLVTSASATETKYCTRGGSYGTKEWDCNSGDRGGAHLGGWAGAAGDGKQRGFRVMCLPPQ